MLIGSLATFSVTGLIADEPALVLTEQLQHIYFTGVPQSLEDLRLMDRYQQELVKQVTQVTVGLEIGATRGSGVIISKDGYVLTASHVAGRPGLDVQIIMPDGRQYDGETLGMNRDVDAALIKMELPEHDGKPIELACAEMGDNSQLQVGSWCMALGHPGGFQDERQPVVRFGRVLAIREKEIETDCKLVGGDSGGPLFDMRGRVVAVHSRIGSKVSKNLHVPVNKYRSDWDRLARGDAWGSLLDLVGRPVDRPILGVLGDKDNAPRITKVLPASPAERAGLQSGDVVTRFANEEIDTFDRLKELVNRQSPGDAVTIEVTREQSKLEFRVVLGAISSG